MTTVATVTSADSGQLIDLKNAVILDRQSTVAGQVLSEEVKSRTGLKWSTVATVPDGATVVVELAIEDGSDVPLEGYRIGIDSSDQNRVTVQISGADRQGLLFGVGNLLRVLVWGAGVANVPADLDVTTSPAYPVRGHQLGYRPTANSYDAWSPEQYDQYIRELALLGGNAIENILYQDGENELMKLTRSEMNQHMSQVCARYGMAYWIWTPVEFDLNDSDRRADLLVRHEKLYRETPNIDALMFPGADPGSNHPDMMLPFLEEIAELLAQYHPNGQVWMSMQGFHGEKGEYVYDYLKEHNPDWLAGIVAGPQSPPMQEMRQNIPEKYPIRRYPDITHNVRCQYPVAWWDLALNLTLGREAPNPRPLDQHQIHNRFAKYSNGFITYSDGIHDDVNKAIWTRLGWDPDADLREILIEYASLFFGPTVAERAADGLRAFEQNWEGSLADNGGVDATLALWQQLENESPQLSNNWRWQLCLLRANYDAYTRHRLLYEQELEDAANVILARAAELGPAKAMDDALSLLSKAETDLRKPELRQRIEELCVALFDSIGLQSSVERFGASGVERGAVLDLVDRPINNRWWLEDQFAAIRSMGSEDAKLERLATIASWEHPGEGSTYDDLGNVAKSQHVLRGGGLEGRSNLPDRPTIGFMWWDDGKSRLRVSWLSNMHWPTRMRYENLDPGADYILRMTGTGELFPIIDGKRLEPTIYSTEIGEFREYTLPKPAYADGDIEFTWDDPDDMRLNWRQWSYIHEVWLLKR